MLFSDGQTGRYGSDSDGSIVVSYGWPITQMDPARVGIETFRRGYDQPDTRCLRQPMQVDEHVPGLVEAGQSTGEHAAVRRPSRGRNNCQPRVMDRLAGPLHDNMQVRVAGTDQNNVSCWQSIHGISVGTVLVDGQNGQD